MASSFCPTREQECNNKMQNIIRTFIEMPQDKISCKYQIKIEIMQRFFVSPEGKVVLLCDRYVDDEDGVREQLQFYNHVTLWWQNSQ